MASTLLTLLQSPSLADAVDAWNFEQLISLYNGLHDRRRAQEEGLLTEEEPRSETVTEPEPEPAAAGGPEEEPPFAWHVAP